MIWNNKLFLSLNVINGKKSIYGIKDIIRHYHHQSDTELGRRIFAIRRIIFN